METSETFATNIAIIGMSGRFPGAKNVDEFWQKLQEGVELISFFSTEELLAAGLDDETLSNPNYVKAKGILEGLGLFDAPFFGYSPREAEIIDPQQRILLTCAWEALEHAGYNAEAYAGRIGVFGGTGFLSYLSLNLFANRSFMETADIFQVSISNDKDFAITRISYKLNLKGPSLTVQTACSTSLVAVHLACQSLLNGECDMALAGGISASSRQQSGYTYREGGILSPDGHCRAFDARAQGTVPGGGAGLVVLKRLSDALADGDSIYAVIKGSAMNNDGSGKVGYTAPSIDGQAEVIAEALDIAQFEANTITYIETHGTATPLGDPIEIAALNQVYSARTNAKGFCAIGSVKSNVGHLDTAAGIAGLIKTTLALKHKMLPPSLHYEQPNPKIDFANSPFYVNAKLSPWQAGTTPRRAAVSSFGIGGTNAHVVLEEAPSSADSGAARSWQLLVLSAKTSTALEKATDNLVEHLKQHRPLILADVAYTYQVGRKDFNHRRALVCQDISDALQVLETRDPQRMQGQVQEQRNRPVMFLFPGQGAQYVHMAHDLYQEEPTFRQHIDSCSELLKPMLGLDLRTILFPTSADEENASCQINQTILTQAAIFVVEYALARLWIEWGAVPQAMLGHSIGEYVAACLADVFSLEDALSLVAARGRLMQDTQRGTMLSVPLSTHDVTPLLGKQLSLAANNAPTLCVVSGPIDAVEALHNQLASKGIDSRYLFTSHAFHSETMEPILQPFIEQVRKIRLNPPTIPYISNVTGTWITAAETTDPTYWTRHLRQTVRFAEGIRELVHEPNAVLLEVGPGRTLCTLARQSLDKGGGQLVLTSMRHAQEQQSDVAVLQSTLGKLWLAGVAVDWQSVHAHERRQHLPLPTYPFELKHYWIEPELQLLKGSPQPNRHTNQGDVDETQAPLVEEKAVSAQYERPNLQTPYVAPGSEIEERLAAIWQDILGIAPVGIYDNFFEMGGHSLMATQLLSQLRTAFPVEIPLRTIFEAPTIAQLSEAIEEILIAMLEEMPEDGTEPKG